MKNLYSELEALLCHSYSPFSKFKVASIVITADGKKYCGVNVENVSFGATNCAERSALFNAISNGIKKGEIVELHLTTSTDQFIYPCFICRQVMLELMSTKSLIYIYKNQKDVQKLTITDLTPFAFDKF